MSWAALAWGGIDWTIFLVAVPVLLVSLVVHELAHGFVADLLGDDTARIAGRLSLNPLRHLDPFGSLVLLLTLVGSQGHFAFGWARPVPVDPSHFRSPRHGMMLVAAAGPGSNLGLALLAALAVRVAAPVSDVIAGVALLVFVMNLILALINVLPVPPLDGSRIVGGLLPRSAYGCWQGLDRYQMPLLLGLLAVVYLFPGVLSAYLEPVLRQATRLLLPPEFWLV